MSFRKREALRNQLCVTLFPHYVRNDNPRVTLGRAKRAFLIIMTVIPKTRSVEEFYFLALLGMTIHARLWGRAKRAFLSILNVIPKTRSVEESALRYFISSLRSE
jgi:hypothetical protein